MIAHLLDTNVISEWQKPQPNAGLVDWLDRVDEDEICLSVVTIGEIRRGVELLPDGRRRARLQSWLTDELPDRFAGRLLPVDTDVAHAWGRLTAAAGRRGTTVEAADGLIAATADVHGLAGVTRNESHFQAAGVRVINPWT